MYAVETHLCVFLSDTFVSSKCSLMMEFPQRNTLGSSQIDCC